MTQTLAFRERNREMARQNRWASLLAAGLILALCGGLRPSPTMAQGNVPPPELKAFFDAINALRSDPAGNSNLIYDLAQARQADYATQPFFTTEQQGDGKTASQHFAELAAWLKSQSPTEKLQWDADLAAFAVTVNDQIFNARLKPDFINHQANYIAEKPEWVIFWWAFFSGGEGTIKPLLDPKLKYFGMVRRVTNDPQFPECFVLASKLQGKLYTRTDFSGFPFDARIDPAPPKSTSYTEVKIPEIVPFVKADGTVDAAWRDQGKQPRIRFWRFGVGARNPSSREIGTVDAAEYPYLAGFTEDGQGNLYVLRARSEPNLQFVPQPATPPDVEARLYDRPEMFRLTQLDSQGAEIWSKNLGKDYGSAQATFSPMTPVINDGNETNFSTSRIAFTTIREPVYTLVDDPSVVVPRNIAEKALLGYVTGPQGDKIDWLFQDGFFATEAGGVLTPKTFLMTGSGLDQGFIPSPYREKEKRAPFYSDGTPQGIGDSYAFDTTLYANFLAYVQRNKVAWFDQFSTVPAEKLRMTVRYEQVPVIFHLYACFTDIDGSSRHQQAYFRAVRADNGDPVLARNGWAVGHSFQSLILPSTEGVITVERSDAGLAIANYMKYAYTRDHRAFIFNHAYNENNCFSELGAIAPASDGYLVLFTSNHSPNPVQSLGRNVALVNAEEERSRDLAIVRIREGFVDQLDQVGQFPFLYSSPTNPGSPATPESIFALGGVTSPVYLTDLDAERKYSATRPKMVRLGDGSVVVFYERWNHQVLTRGDGVKEAQESYDATVAMLIDENGNILRAPTVLPGDPRLMRGDDAFLYEGKAAWLSGDIVDGKMVLHTIDSGLNHEAIVLPL
jgi:hypothetical protein